ncbi:MAG: hypothetical protein RL211_13 [Pseudomonadota bacterium]|jgi:predicted nucleic acid-binding protein
MAALYVLDTNVVSELMREQPNPAALDRLAALDDSAWHITTITEAELRHGVALLPAGKNKARLSTALNALLSQDFAGRIISFDSAASAYYADMMASRSKAGKPMQVQDAMIAACCLAQVGTLVTRNARDFEGVGLTVVNPWG